MVRVAERARWCKDNTKQDRYGTVRYDDGYCTEWRYDHGCCLEPMAGQRLWLDKDYGRGLGRVTTTAAGLSRCGVIGCNRLGFYSICQFCQFCMPLPCLCSRHPFVERQLCVCVGGGGRPLRCPCLVECQGLCRVMHPALCVWRRAGGVGCSDAAEPAGGSGAALIPMACGQS